MVLNYVQLSAILLWATILKCLITDKNEPTSPPPANFPPLVKSLIFQLFRNALTSPPLLDFYVVVKQNFTPKPIFQKTNLTSLWLRGGRGGWFVFVGILLLTIEEGNIMRVYNGEYVALPDTDDNGLIENKPCNR